ncbi:MAG: hypothetical protein ACR2O4_10560 [Hyphomicrobiaceae bacterium]
MDRRTFLKSTGLTSVSALSATGLAASTSIAGTALQNHARVLTLAMSAPDLSADTALIARRVSEAIEAATDTGIQIVTGENTGHDTSDISLAPIAEHKETHPAWPALFPLVHGLDSGSFNEWITAAGGGPLIEELGRETGKQILLVGQTHTPDGLWSSHDLKDASGSGRLDISADGRTLVLNPENAGTATELKLARGHTGNGTSENPQNRKLYALPAPASGEPVALTIASPAWESLSSAEQAIISAVATAEHATVTTEVRVTTAMARSMTGQHDPLPLPASLTEQYHRTIEAERQRIAASGPLGANLIGSQRAYRQMVGEHLTASSQDRYIG